MRKVQPCKKLDSFGTPMTNGILSQVKATKKFALRILFPATNIAVLLDNLKDEDLLVSGTFFIQF
jgi:hypothetical protein